MQQTTLHLKYYSCGCTSYNMCHMGAISEIMGLVDVDCQTVSQFLLVLSSIYFRTLEHRFKLISRC